MIREFEKLVICRAPRFEVSLRAPDTWQALQESKSIVISPYGSETAVFPLHVNLAFRAWHDSIHLKVCADFSLAGESKACEAQIEDLYKATTNRALRRFGSKILECEIVLQAEYFFKTGMFVADQKAFTLKAFGGRLEG